MAVVAVMIAAGVANGCGQRRAADLVPVGGTVLRQGRPVANATVIFLAEPPHEAALAFGAVGDDGRYELLSANRYRGISPGRYLVCVSVAADAGDGSSDPFAPAGRTAAPDYARPDMTPLRFEVRPEGGTFDIFLP